ncbi:Gfo/Idh/MocA family oxidoreductase [Amycolatopsis pigmentata]|uniref:Inositol 2-dehydrogenase n=1 Tax=Amycolatopsis pigmentata TaxID=450801 RepID=A0ABW5FRY4_9PSEU
MTVHIGVIGAGAIGADHVRRIGARVPGAAVVAVADIDPARAGEVASGAGARVLPSGLDVVTDPHVDAVLVTSWGPTHADYLLAAIDAGKPVFTEKPMVTTAADGLRIVEAEQSSGRRLVRVGFMRRHDAGYRAMKEVLASGEIGTPLLMHCVHRNATAPETYHSEMAIRDTAVHEIDLIRWLLDDEVVSAQVISPRRTSRRFEHLQDPQFMLFETASGVRVDLEVFVNCQYGYDIRCEVVGEMGTVELPHPADVWVRSGARLRTPVLQDWSERFAAAFDDELIEWVASVREGRASGPDSWDGYAVAAVTDAAAESLGSGEVLPVLLDKRPAFYG